MTLSPLASRIVAWGLLANLCWAAGIFIVGPLLNQINEDREAIARLRQLLARYRQLEAGLASTQAQLAEFRGRAGNDKYFFTSSSPALTAAEMQNVVQRLVSGSGASLRSSRTVAPSVEKGFDRLAVDLELTASNSTLTTLLRAIALAEPILLIDRMLAQVPENGVTATGPDGQPSVAVTLRLVSYGRSAATGAKL
jgi:general secretion pathway protein M